MEDGERQKKLEAGKAKLAQFRQRKAHGDGQNIPKKQKKKKRVSNTKEEDSVQGGLTVDQSQGEDEPVHSCQRGAAATSDFARVRTLHSDEMFKHDQTYTTELESEISTTADDYSSEEEEFGFEENSSEPGLQHSLTRLEMMEKELAGKQQEVEELNRELEEMRAAYGTEGLQQLQEFEAAIKKRDDIITQLTTNLQQARKEKDETMREFLELTEQSQKLQIQFQHLQASENLRNTSHSSTAADLLQAKQQILTYQQQLEEQEHLLRNYQMKNEDFEVQLSLLHQRIIDSEMEKCKTEDDSTKKKLQEKDTIIEELEAKIIEEEEHIFIHQKKLIAAESSLKELNEELLQKNQEVHNVTLELTSWKQKERQCSNEIKQLMGSVEELQKRCHKDGQLEKDIVQRMELEAQQRLAGLRAELEEVHGQQIVHMKQELLREHTLEIEKLLAEQKADLERRDLSQHLEVLSSEKSCLQNQLEELCQELSFAREQIHRARQTINEKEAKLRETDSLQTTVGDLKAQLSSASEIQKELELNHEAEVTNYKIKLEMLEKEKDAVLDRMAESQEAELERLRTHLLFSHEEELSKLRDDLQQDHRISTETLKDNLVAQHKQQLERLQNDMSKKLEAMQFENDNLITKQNQLLLEVSKLNDLQQSTVNSKSEEMMLQIHELQKEIDVLRQEEKEKGTLEQEVQELRLQRELLEQQMKEREDSLQEKCSLLETKNNILEDENKALQDKLNKHAAMNIEEHVIFMDSVSSSSRDFEFQKRIENLIEEKEKLVKEVIELKEELERQKNGSFAEEHSEYDYQALQEKYATLVKAKSDLEEVRNKQEAEYKAKLQVLMEEIQHLQGDTPLLLKTQSSTLHEKRERILRSETYDVEVIEKDTTELMEKLEVSQREKLELSLRVSDLSEQLKLKHNEICQLGEKVQSLKHDKEYISSRCKELELLVSQEEARKTCDCKAKYSNGRLQAGLFTVSEPGNSVCNSNEGFDVAIREKETKLTASQSVIYHIAREERVQQKLNSEPTPVLDNLQQVNDGLVGNFSGISIMQNENKLQEQLDELKSEQSDLKLQMEAQRICLSLVYSAHLDQVREDMENEKETALSALKEELQYYHAQELYDLKKKQLDLYTLRDTSLDDEGQAVCLRLERLSKTVAEECTQLTQSLHSILHEKSSNGLEAEDGERGKFNTVLRSITEAQGTLQTLINQIMEEFHRLLEYHVQFMKARKKGEEQAHAGQDEKEIDKHRQNAERLPISSQDLIVRPPPREDMENFISHLEEQHAQEVEHLRSYFHQQLKETEERYTTEIGHLQSRIQVAKESSECFSTSVDSQVNEMMQKEGRAGSGLQQNAGTTEEVPNEVNIIENMEKQYQEKLLEEIAKVVVTMSVEFAQQNEFARIANLNTGELSLMEPIQSQQNDNLNKRKECSEELISHINGKRCATYEELKSFSREISEECNEMASLGEQFQSDVKSAKMVDVHDIDSRSQKDSPSHDKEQMQKRPLVTCEASTSSIMPSSQIALYEERLEDMRQELVRQYQEHQHATEMLRQGHMQQMEWQKENQEQLLAELERLKIQLAENIMLDNENITEREQMLLEELESLKKQSTPMRETLSCELQNSETQTQSETPSQTESRKHILEGEDGRGKHDETSQDILSEERHALQKANNRLLKILLEVVKTVVAVEETIGRHVVCLLDQSSKCQLSFKSVAWEARTEDSKKPSILVGYEAENSSSPYRGSDLKDGGGGLWSGVTEEGLDLTQFLTEHGFAGIEIENEELVLNVSSRLQAAVEKLLEAINETTNQLEHAKVTQTELMRESFKQGQDAAESLRCQEELQDRLDEEIKTREQLALELSKAEHLIDGYADEKSLLESQIQEKTDVIVHLEQDLLCTGNKLQELEAERQQLQEEKELLFRQKDAMKAEAGPIEKRLVDAAVDAASQAELLAETEKLMKEKIEVQRQAEKEYGYLQKQVKVLESDIEEQVNRFWELEQEKNAELMDVRQQNQALEKHLEKTKKFLDEQAIDREHERDVFQQEIQKLEQQLKLPQRVQPVNEHQNREVEQLTNHLKEKTDKCSELLLSKEQLQRDVQERNDEIEKLEYRIRELEQALMISADSLQKVEERKQFGSASIREDLPLEAQLQAEQEAVDRKEKEIINLEEQLEQFREELENKNEEVQQLHMQLEIQRKESATRQQELEQENKLLKEEMEKLDLVVQNPEDTSVMDHHPVAGKIAQIMQEKEQEINELHEQISKLQQQLEITTDNKMIEEQNEYVRELEAQIEYLRSDQERLKQNKELETEQLNDVIEKLQQELANIEHKVPLGFSSIQEDTDHLKHQLDIALAEKDALVKQVESNTLEVSLAKNELEEAKTKMSKLKKELDTLREKHERMGERHEQVQIKSGKTETRAKVKVKNENPKAANKKKAKMLNSEISVSYVEENSKDSFSEAETKLQQLQKALKEKDSKLNQCYNQIKDLKERAHTESEAFKQKIVELEEMLEQKVAVALVSQAQLNAVLEQNKETVSEDAGKATRMIPAEKKINSAVEESAKSRLSVLSEKLSEMERQLANAHNTLELEKTKVEVAENEAKEKEARLVELQQLLAKVEEKHKREKTKSSKQGKMQPLQVVAGPSESKQRPVLTADFELEKVRTESAAAKEELNNYREKAEKLKEELTVKETSVLHLQEELRQTKEKLTQAEEKLADYVRKQEGIDELKSTCTKVELAINTTDASCQTDTVTNIKSCSQTSQCLVKNEGIQIDLQNGCSSEEVAEIIREFSEKIDQMQELHAAEIMDMETRHISESEALKRDKFAAVQQLTEERNALKGVIGALSDKEGTSCVAQPASSNARDGFSSDSSSDWSQAAYLAPSQGSDTISEGIVDEGETATDFLPNTIKGLLTAVHHEGIQVLSLSEFPYNESDASSQKQSPEAWLDERKAFLSTVSSLKDLIAKMQMHRETTFYPGSESSECFSDWRSELLYAVQQVFQRERDVLLAVFRTELAEAGTRDAVTLMDQLEKRLQEQGTYQQTAVGCIQNADRRSLLMEVRLLRSQLSNRRTDPQGELGVEPKCQEVLGYTMDMQMELDSVKDKVAGLQEQLNSERMVVAELRNALGQTKLELETTLKAQHKHLKDLEAVRNELRGKTAELDTLKDTVASEQKKAREFQWALEKAKARMDLNEERGREELEDLKYSLENEKQRTMQLNELLEHEKQLSNDLKNQIVSQETLSTAQLCQEQSCNSELQVLLESERFRVHEISSALEREKELCAQLQMAEQTLKPAEELLRDLQKQLDEKHDRIVALVSEMERYKLETVQLKQQLEKESQIQRTSLQIEQDANILAQKKVHDLESKVEDLEWQLGEKRKEIHLLQCDQKKLQETVQELHQKEQSSKAGSKVEETASENLNEASWDTSNERTRKWVFQQKMGETETKELSYSALSGMRRGGGDATEEYQDVQTVMHKLRHVSSKLKHLAIKAAHRLPFEKQDDEDFVRIQNNIEEVLLQLQIFFGLSNLEAEGREMVISELPTSCSLTERLLKQNAELTGFVSRLSEEKNNFRNAVMKLEEERRRYQQRRPCGGETPSGLSLHNGGSLDAFLASEREIWNKEKLTLQQSLKQAEAELAKLRAELRTETFLRELGADSENAVLKRIYGRYLRAESFRKALVYQKKYLLLLLGGFQECEEATLSLIARMGGQPFYTNLEIITHHSKGFTRFRSAARVLIAISRMKFLVRRWHRITSYSFLGISRDGFSQNAGKELRPDSFSGELELYGEHRPSSSYRSRSELESLRSPLSYQQHRYQGIHADLSPVSLACSQLQNYDPDRALTDYINRLEALQRRLGTVQSAPAPYTQLHSGIRR